MKDDYIKRLEQYFNQELDDKGMAEFQKQLAEDDAFAAAFEARKQIEDFLEHRPKREHLKQNIRAIGDSYFQEAASDTAQKEGGKRISLQSRLYWLSGAAAAVLLLIFTWPFLFNSPPTYSQFAEHRPLSLQEKSAGIDTLIDIENAFNRKDYQKAYEELAAYLQNNPNDITAIVYKGICALELDQLTEATTTFTEISKGNTAFKQTAQWYLALTYLKKGDFENTKVVLSGIPEGSFWYPKGTELLRQLP